MESRRKGKIVAINSKAAGRLNSIGLSQSELDRLLTELDGDLSSPSPRRLYARWKFNSPSVQMLLKHSSGTEIPIRVACRNLSCGGASVLHSAYVHTGSLCTLMLPRRGGAAMPCTGKVVRCTHRQGTIHELGIAFDRPIRMREFFSEGTMLDRYSFENVDPSKLDGCLLVVSGSPLQQKSVGALLADTSVRIRAAASCAAAGRRTRECRPDPLRLEAGGRHGRVAAAEPAGDGDLNTVSGLDPQLVQARTDGGGRRAGGIPSSAAPGRHAAPGVGRVSAGAGDRQLGLGGRGEHRVAAAEAAGDAAAAAPGVGTPRRDRVL
ncbi:MAG: PilZ domain-containing protein [Phycisphaerales bacterium]|nr:PilZ domain-containing protein [Phycisphaerales bacterium]